SRQMLVPPTSMNVAATNSMLPKTSSAIRLSHSREAMMESKNLECSDVFKAFPLYPGVANDGDNRHESAAEGVNGDRILAMSSRPVKFKHLCHRLACGRTLTYPAVEIWAVSRILVCGADPTKTLW